MNEVVCVCECVHAYRYACDLKALMFSVFDMECSHVLKTYCEETASGMYSGFVNM